MLDMSKRTPSETSRASRACALLAALLLACGLPLRAKGLPVAYVPFEGEQHGFRRAENIKRALDGEIYFYSRIFGFELADNVEPVPIENL